MSREYLVSDRQGREGTYYDDDGEGEHLRRIVQSVAETFCQKMLETKLGEHTHVVTVTSRDQRWEVAVGCKTEVHYDPRIIKETVAGVEQSHYFASVRLEKPRLAYSCTSFITLWATSPSGAGDYLFEVLDDIILRLINQEDKDFKNIDKGDVFIVHIYTTEDRNYMWSAELEVRDRKAFVLDPLSFRTNYSRKITP